MANATYEAVTGTDRANFASYVNIVGSVISLAVFVGIFGWGIQTILRDSSGVPVVRALDGPVRIAPEVPGGLLASHQGLTVNEVSSSQIHVALEDRLQLAPRPINLMAEDQPIVMLLANSAEKPSLKLVSLEALGATDNIPTINETPKVSGEVLSSSTPVIPNASDFRMPGLTNAAASIGSGPAISLRPRVRSTVIVLQHSLMQIVAAPQVILQGAPMAQLGAFGSKKMAMQAWTSLSQRHGDYLVGKQHVILEATVGGNIIYRLRVHGFASLADSRRICTALISQNAECYSVLMN